MADECGLWTVPPLLEDGIICRSANCSETDNRIAALTVGLDRQRLSLPIVNDFQCLAFSDPTSLFCLGDVMKTIALLGSGITCAVGSCIAAASIASIILAAPERHTFASETASDLWTTAPVRIDRSAQSFERVPAQFSTYALAQPSAKTGLAKGPATVAAPVLNTAMSSEHLSWCIDRYRSFDAKTNTYRSFSGQTRTCYSPYESGPSTTVTAAESVQPTSVTAAAASWCSARYQSYRVEDNTYQPYDGPRRACEGPRASSEVASR